MGTSPGPVAVSGARLAGENPEVIPFAVLLCQHVWFGGTCFFPQRGKGEVWVDGLAFRRISPGLWNRRRTDVFSGSKLVFIFWVGISQISCREVEDGGVPYPAGRISASCTSYEVPISAVSISNAVTSEALPQAIGYNWRRRWLLWGLACSARHVRGKGHHLGRGVWPRWEM